MKEQYNPVEYWETEGVDNLFLDKEKRIKNNDNKQQNDINKLVENYNIKSALEVGCGYGRIIKHIKCNKIEGCDLSKRLLNELKKENNNIKTKNCDITKGLPYEDNSFDLVYSCEVLLHIKPEDVKNVISEMIRVSNRYVWIHTYWEPKQSINCPYWVFLHDYDKMIKELGYLYVKEKVGQLGINILIDKQNQNQNINIDNYVDLQKRQNAPQINSAPSGNRNWSQCYYVFNKVPNYLKTTLDIGCGDGYWTKELLTKSIKTVGIDIVKEFIDVSKRYENEDVNFYVMDMNNMQFEDNSFDCVYADNSIEHSYNVQKTFDEIYRILKENGVLIALLPLDGIIGRGEEETPHLWEPKNKDDILFYLKKFKNKNVEIIDCSKEFKIFYAPSDNKMAFVYAVKGDKMSDLERLQKLSVDELLIFAKRNEIVISLDKNEDIKQTIINCICNSYIPIKEMKNIINSDKRNSEVIKIESEILKKKEEKNETEKEIKKENPKQIIVNQNVSYADKRGR